MRAPRGGRRQCARRYARGALLEAARGDGQDSHLHGLPAFLPGTTLVKNGGGGLGGNGGGEHTGDSHTGGHTGRVEKARVAPTTRTWIMGSFAVGVCARGFARRSWRCSRFTAEYNDQYCSTFRVTMRGRGHELSHESIRGSASKPSSRRV